jgi:hypothetical protein
MSVIQQFLQATAGERESILKDDNNIDLLVTSILEDLQDPDISESYKVVILVSVLEVNSTILLSKSER